MEFLQKIFDAEINEDEKIIILGSPFYRADIIRELEPETYYLAFKEWLNTRKGDLIEIADEILAFRKNKLRFEKLQKLFEGDALIPFVGAGMSIPSDYPGWTKFLFELCEESDISEADLNKLLSNGEYELAAEKIHDDLASEQFNELLENEFSADKEILGPVNYLPELFPKSFVLTTNFDTVLERVYNQNKKGFDDLKSGKSLNECAKHIVDGSRYLVKLHGTCNQVMDRVLTFSEYESSYSEDDSLYKFFKRAMISKSILFIGCSLSSDRTIQTMMQIVKEEGANEIPRHYALLADIKDDNLRKEKQRFLAKANIFPIWYDGDHEESIEALFVKLENGNT